MILSVGGGTSPGMPKQNIEAMLRRWRNSIHDEWRFENELKKLLENTEYPTSNG